MSQFVDQVRIKVRSGDGGNGIVAWRREKYEPLGGPAGGTGGAGGSVYLEATDNLSTLMDFHFRSEFKASPGERGRSKNMHGKDGQDLVIRVPVGTVVTVANSGKNIADLSVAGAKVLIARGGRGGRGNSALSTQGRGAPHYCEPGEVGIEREIQLTLKLIADVGLAGLPNAGKSTLLSVVTAARPKIADYPFTTLVPQLGVMRFPDGDGIVLADIPGLIRGASTGAGLGHQFLRHIERTRLIVHVADISQDELEADLTLISQELLAYDPVLAARPRILFLNKSDLLDEEMAADILAKVRARLAQLFAGAAGQIKTVIVGSCVTGKNMDKLKGEIREQLSKIAKPTAELVIFDDPDADLRHDDTYSVTRSRNVFYVSGPRVERILSVTNLKDPEALLHFAHILRSMGIIDELQTLGIEPGQELVIGKQTFTYGEGLY